MQAIKTRDRSEARILMNLKQFRALFQNLKIQNIPKGIKINKELIKIVLLNNPKTDKIKNKRQIKIKAKENPTPTFKGEFEEIKNFFAKKWPRNHKEANKIPAWGMAAIALKKFQLSMILNPVIMIIPYTAFRYFLRRINLI